MATYSNFLRSLSLRACAFRRVLQDRCVTVHPLAGVLTAQAQTIVRLQHSEASSAGSNVADVVSQSRTAADAEQTPVIIDNDLIAKMLEEAKEDMPVPDMPDPFQKEHKRCILCVHNLDVDYKNVQLLSQFVSPYTGRIYGRAVTGLCIPMQKRVANAIKRSRKAGYMPFMLKQPEYLKDPRLFDPFKPAKSS